MAYAIKAEIRDPRARSFTFQAQKTMYGGRRIAPGDTIYLFASENNNYYYHPFILGPQTCKPVSNPNESSYLFSALNLSVGVETGLSNSLSLLVAPYMKLPVRRIGVGQVQMNTVGINFSLRWAPVISRKRY